MKRKFISILLTSVMVMTLLCSVCTVASATTVRNLSTEGFVESSATPQQMDTWQGNYTATVTNGANSSRLISCSGTRTDTHMTIPVPKSAVGSSAAPKILHLSYRIWNDRTNPAYITHRMQYNSGLKDGFVTTDTQFTLADDSSKNITSFGSAYNYLDPYDYKVDLYENLQTGAYQIYLNGVKWVSAYDYSTPKNYLGSGSSSINEYRIRVTGAKNSSWAFTLVNPCYELYTQDVLMDDIIAATASAMSNYLNATGPSATAPSTADSKSGTITVSPEVYTTTTDTYTATGVSSGARLIWWSGDEGQGTGHKVKFASAGVVSGKEWFHMGFNITGTNVGIQLKGQMYATSDGKSKDGWGIMDGYTGTNYRADYIWDLANSLCYIYYNNAFYELKNDDFIKQLRRIYLEITTNTNFTISNISFEYYAKGVSPRDIFAGYESRTKTTYDYIYSISGIKSGTNVIGKMGGLCNITGDNSSGYTLAPGSINANNGGFARYALNYTEDTGIYQSTDDKVLVHTAYYKPSVVSSGSKHQIGIRGNNGYEWHLFAQNGAFYDMSGNYLKSYDTNTFYRIDFVINNKDYKCYWLLDGICFDGGTLSAGRQPLWQIVYTMWNTSDRIVLKSVQTTLYKSNYTLLAKLRPLMSTSKIYAELESCSVSNGTATVVTSYIANTKNPANGNTKVIYAIYNSAGQLLRYQTAGSSSNVNGSNLSTAVTVPTGGTTLKVFMWNLNLGSSVLTPIANSITKSLQ